ncbi:MAG: nucleotidyltransferase domain-containing protein [Caulobacterales bacterium]
MTVSTVALFGSRARGDQEDGSDIDLLLVTQEDRPRHVTMGNLSLSFYPLEDLLAGARQGDLFVCHLCQEAKPIYDPAHELGRLRSALRLRASYSDVVKKASDLAWYLARYGGQLPHAHLVNRRIAWCVRTILISRAAELRRPVFSAGQLAAFADDPGVERLIRRKMESDPPSSRIRGRLRALLVKWGTSDPVGRTACMDAYRTVFESTESAVALQTLKGLADTSDYG